MQLWLCQRTDGDGAEGESPDIDRRGNVRWERLGEVLRDLEELRSGLRREPVGLSGSPPNVESGASQPGGGDAEGS